MIDNEGKTFIVKGENQDEDYAAISAVIEDFANNNGDNYKARCVSDEPYKISMLQCAKMLYSDWDKYTTLVIDDIESIYDFYYDLSTCLDHLLKERLENFEFTDANIKFPASFGAFLVQDQYYHDYLEPLLSETQNTVLRLLRDKKFWDYDLKYYQEALSPVFESRVIYFDGETADDRYFGHKVDGSELGSPSGIEYAIGKIIDSNFYGADGAECVKYTGIKPMEISLIDVVKHAVRFMDSSNYLEKLMICWGMYDTIIKNIRKFRECMENFIITIPEQCKEFRNFTFFIEDNFIYENLLSQLEIERLSEMRAIESTYMGFLDSLNSIRLGGLSYSDTAKQLLEYIYLLYVPARYNDVYLGSTEHIGKCFSDTNPNLNAVIDIYYSLTKELKNTSKMAEDMRGNFERYFRQNPDEGRLRYIILEQHPRFINKVLREQGTITNADIGSLVESCVEILVAAELDNAEYPNYIKKLRKVQINTSLADVVECYLKNHPEKLLEAIKESSYLDSGNLPENIEVVISGVEFTVEPKDYLGALK